jgi:hypothetical protein
MREISLRYPYGTTDYSWDDCISSVRVAPGWSATLYRDPDYDDDHVTVTSDVPDFTAFPHDCPEDGLNDCVSSYSDSPAVKSY